MAALDLAQISSNWKALQVKLREGRPSQPASSFLKRKRPQHERYTKERPSKSLKASTGIKRQSRKRLDMGGILSSAGDAVEEASLQQDFDVQQAKLETVKRGSARTVHEDQVNAGRHAVHKAGKYLSLDCEMVGTGPPPHADDLLARVSIVNFLGEQIYDTYVLPVHGMEVKDYRTHVSGIRREHLRPGVARPFTEVQKEVSALLRGKVLVGHALRKDIQTLQVDHPKRDIRDTSRHPAYRIESRGKPPALRHLAKRHLGLDIQQGEHSSLEDARAAMLLYKRDKSAFESDNRKQFGAQKQGRPSKGREDTPMVGTDDEEQFDSDDDDALLQGEEDPDQPAEPSSNTAKKRKKKKKRTKR